MPKTAHMNLRIELETKAKAETLYSNFTISVTDAINIFLNTTIGKFTITQAYQGEINELLR